MRENGAQGRDRTADTVIFSHVLYQLSYLGMVSFWRRAYRGGGARLSSPGASLSASSSSPSVTGMR